MGVSIITSRERIAAVLLQFSENDLYDASLNLFSELEYNISRTERLDDNTFTGFAEMFIQVDQAFDSTKAITGEWEQVEFLFQLTDAEMKDQLDDFDTKEYNDTIIESYVFFAIQLKGRNYSRWQLSQITREINKLFHMPVMILFRYGEYISLAIINRRRNLLDGAKDVLTRITLIKDINTADPHRAHREILYKLSFNELNADSNLASFVHLQQAWENVLSTSELNQNFYRDISGWYYNALQQIKLPRRPEYMSKDEHAKNFLVRLLARMIFCWFLKEKGLINKELLELENNNHVRYPLLKDIDDDNFLASNSYYRGILQNIFFLALNQEKKKGKKDFKWTRYLPDDFDYRKFTSIPYLNGGLFDLLKEEDNTQETIEDGAMAVPNHLFYGQGGLNQILGHYKFTIEENTPLEEDIALDPELLGMVFENLLAELDPNLEQSAVNSIRRQTGSYYTPRKVIQEMVNESLFLYLVNYLKKHYPLNDEYQEKVHDLLFIDIVYTEDTTFCHAVVDALDSIRILDPACGSGAFPMGMLHRMVDILKLVDQKNHYWLDKQLEKIDPIYRDEFKRDLSPHMKDKDYIRKLGIIKNCIYGIDIQPLAIQISKLRFFISLLIDQNTNQGINPMPNLETKLICANSLKNLEPNNLFAFNIKDLQEAREDYYRPDITHEEKEKIADKIAKLLDQFFPQFAKEVTGRNIPGQNQELLKEWFMHASVAAPFFNWRLCFPEIEGTGGFDIVIGNPPYGGTKISDDIKNSLGLESKDIYGAFIARFLSSGDVPLKLGGVLAYIVSDTFMTIKSHKPLRKQMMNHYIHKMIRVDPDTFKATVNTAIIICERNPGEHNEIPEDHHCQMVDMTNISFHENYERFIEVLHQTEGFNSRQNESNSEYAIYYYPQNLIKTCNILPFFVASPKLFAFMNDGGPSLKTEWTDIGGNKTQVRIINMNGKDIRIIKLEQIAEAKQGLATGDNKAYVFQNQEARGTYRNIDEYSQYILTDEDLEKIRHDENLRIEIIEKGICKKNTRSKRYFEGRYIIPYDKGGESDTESGWLPNYYVPTNFYIDWSEWAVSRMRSLTIAERIKINNEPKAILDNYKYQLAAVFRNVDTYFKQGITFSPTGIYSPTFRFNSAGVFGNKGSCIFIADQSLQPNVLIGILASKLSKYFLKNFISHTIETGEKVIMNLPLVPLVGGNNIRLLVEKIVRNQKNEAAYDYASNEQIEIDHLIYEAYGLNEEDIQEVENWYARRYPKLANSDRYNNHADQEE